MKILKSLVTKLERKPKALEEQLIGKDPSTEDLYNRIAMIYNFGSKKESQKMKTGFVISSQKNNVIEKVTFKNDKGTFTIYNSKYSGSWSWENKGFKVFYENVPHFSVTTFGYLNTLKR